MNETNLTLAAYNQYRTTFPAIELIGGVLWDTVQFVSAAINNLFLFNAIRATADLTNMDTPGMLTNNKGFLIRAIRFKLQQVPRSTTRAATGNVQVGAFDNIAQLLNTGFLRLTIGAKPYLEMPLWTIPAGDGPHGGFAVDGDLATTGQLLDYASNGVPSSDNALVLSQPLFIAPLINFNVNVFWPAPAITLAGGSSNIQVLFDGDLMRPVQ